MGQGISDLKNASILKAPTVLSEEEMSKGVSDLENASILEAPTVLSEEEKSEGSTNLNKALGNTASTLPLNGEISEGVSYLENASILEAPTVLSEEEKSEGSKNLNKALGNTASTLPLNGEISEGVSDLENASILEAPTVLSEEEKSEGVSDLEDESIHKASTVLSGEEKSDGSKNLHKALGNTASTLPLNGEISEDMNNVFQEVLFLLKMENYRTREITLSDVLEIGTENLKHFDLQTLEQIPWNFLRKIMALNVTARSTRLVPSVACGQESSADNEEQGIGDCDFVFSSEDASRLSINPLDVLCVLLHCSDTFLQQEIMQKMSMCQFALPLLLPPCDGTKCTFMLWAMRDIVRKWRPHSLRDSKGFREESLVLTPMTTFAFVRLGSCGLSKSKILNEVLSPPQQHHDFFIHKNMESGNVPRRISNGLVEISCYFPGGRKNSDIFPEPVAVTNLRGSIESHWLQFSFLTEISSALFIFTDSISEGEYSLLSSLKESKTKVYFILIPQFGNLSKETMEYLKRLASDLKLNKSNLLRKDNIMNDAEFVKKLQSTMTDIMKNSPSVVTLEDMAVTARELGVEVDEDCEECQKGNKWAAEITSEIQDVVEYKREMMKLQGDLWKRLAKVEKEFCRMRNQGSTPPEDYKSNLKRELLELRAQQNDCELSNGMITFISAIANLETGEKMFFLKWMKFQLDCIARKNLSNLKAEYKERCNNLATDPKDLVKLDRRISESSLGVEHFLREMGQFYEAECTMVREGKLPENQRQFLFLPDIAAALLLEGFPLELIDGDASNIPLQWVTDVLTELNTKLGGRCRMLVLTVLGVQSTGKSTLLNTMFGLQFSVSSGRCTRGAFMLLIKVKENLKKELGCDFILVIDTEGLKAPELATLEDSYEHDNELATLVIGLSDITIINMAMENATEMKDVLQIAVHAFLRMEETGKKTNCQFVHQNVSDVSAHEQNMRDRKHLLEQLNEMTKAAARMENQSKQITFSDIMEYDPEKHNWYIPGLWHGVPPMAPVNTGYSETVYDLKRYLVEFLRNGSLNQAAQDIPSFIEWVKSLWNAVKHENFIFSFRNSLVAEAYNQLSMKYSEWEWEFCKEMHLWESEAETKIQNQSPDALDNEAMNTLRHEASQKLERGKEKMLHYLETYFESGDDNVHLIERYREEFFRSATGLKNELELHTVKKCEEAIRILKDKGRIQQIQSKYMKTIEEGVVVCLENCRQKKCKLNYDELKEEFETMWEKIISDVHFVHLERRQIEHDMFRLLRRDLSNQGGSVQQKLQEANVLLNCGLNPFKVSKHHIEKSWQRTLKAFFITECHQKLEVITESIIDCCNAYIEERVNSKADFDETYCKGLLHIINEKLTKAGAQKLHTTPFFEADLKLHILGRAAQAFQKMHDDFVRENDPHCHLKKLKPQYLSTFIDLYLEKDQCQRRARDFCEQCLKPALADHVNKKLGIDIVDDILHCEESVDYSSRTFFQSTILKALLEKNNFDSYVQYINKYETYVKEWILKYIKKRYSQTNALECLEINILSTIIKKVKNVLEQSQGEHTVSALLDTMCKTLDKDLLISKQSLEVILFQNTASVDQFLKEVPFFLSDLEQHLLSDFKSMDFQIKLANLPFQPQNKLFTKVFGCGKQCPFCKAPCEAGGNEHSEHFTSVHRPQGLAQYRYIDTGKLVYSLCSSDVVSHCTFQNRDTAWTPHPYKEYRTYYPEWRIQPDPSIEASDYWKFILKKYNKEFAKEYKALPAEHPEDWKKITKDQALKSMGKTFLIQ